MSNFDLAKAYNPADHEDRIYKSWEAAGAFLPNLDAPKDPFSIILPPPNANGNLHVGHAMYVVEDMLTRYRRMQGHPTLWLPGADHAGIETQVVYERKLQAEGKSRFDLGREEFYRQVDSFTQENMAGMVGQLKSLGFSLDWSKLTYTLDPTVVETVEDTFKRLHDDGLIYRSGRIVNWCPFCRSAFADIEVKYREQLDPLYYIKYGPFVLATVRPETKFGDTAIAVNPKDERYAKYVGQTITAEDLNGPIELQVIADDHVDPEFGTGVVKVTPAHDPNDWEMGQRHGLEVKQVIGTDGLLTELAGKYAGMPVAEARQQVAHDLEERGLMDHINMDYSHSVGYHDRCGTIIEPLTVEQWWLSVDKLKAPVIEAIKSGEVKFVPERFTKVALDWMDNLRDWNVSRQNWWGIRIPAYYRAGTADASLPEYIIGSEADAIATYGAGNYEAETDNFDTWFSSGQWPYATLMAQDAKAAAAGDNAAARQTAPTLQTSDVDAMQGSAEEHSEVYTDVHRASTTGDNAAARHDRSLFDTFYPTAVMDTGRDILFLWVTRMIMFGLYRTGQVPFKTVYLHGLINDAHGKKMSKSKGNVINPLDMTAKYGTDALRLALTIGITPGNDGSLSENKIEGYRNFCNKLWNVARYTLAQLPEDYSPTDPEPKSLADAWILHKTNAATATVTQAIEDFRLSEAGQTVYSLLWDDLADWYIEASKVDQNPNILYHSLVTVLKLAHPVAPFVTEAIWEALPATDGQLITAQWPQAVEPPQAIMDQAAQFETVKAAVSAIRTISAEEQLSKPAILTTNETLAANAALITKLARAASVELVKTGRGLYLGVAAPAWIEATPELVAARRQRLEATQTEKQAYLRSLKTKLANQGYINNAPAAIIAETQKTHDEVVQLLDKLKEQLEALDG